MARVLFIDLLFNWPPDGGARVDLKEIASRLAAEHEVTLLVPDFSGLFPRGRINGPMPFRIIRVPFNKYTFNCRHLPRMFRKEVERLRPDHLFIADGWYLKFPLAAALSDYHPILRFYAYEGLCIKDYGTQFRDGRICPLNYLDHTAACIRCALRHHRFRPLNMFSQEFLSSLAFTPLYRRSVLRAIKSAKAVIVYNKYMADMLGRYNDRVRTVPSGVDASLFASAPETRPDNK
ncbi:MAG: glycosyltransferase family 4 protein, partial [Candidatus Aureabacteria bacterium]|nr:glycosyltransferase family 4 protein [Candidatus Auribacterota bacterium]